MQKSEKSYVVAVCLCVIFGVIGVHFFYLKRWAEGLFDLGLLVFAITLFFNGAIGWAIVVLCVDLLHSFIVTILLLIGSQKDGDGHIVAYPGQRI